MTPQYIQDKTQALQFQAGGSAALELGQAGADAPTVSSFEIWFKFRYAIQETVMLMHLNEGFRVEIKDQALVYHQDSITTPMPHRKFRTGKWYHLGLVYDVSPASAEDRFVQIYVNGFQIAKIQAQGELRLHETLEIGESFFGLISLVAVWNADMTDRFTGEGRFIIPTKGEAQLQSCWEMTGSGGDWVTTSDGEQSTPLINRTDWAADVKHPRAGGGKGLTSHVFQEIQHNNAKDAAAAHQEATKVVADAHKKASETLQQAHQEAAAIIQNSKFDNIYHIYGGRLRTVDAYGKIKNLTVADSPPGLKTEYVLEREMSLRDWDYSSFFLTKKPDKNWDGENFKLPNDSDIHFQVSKTFTFATWLKPKGRDSISIQLYFDGDPIENFFLEIRMYGARISIEYQWLVVKPGENKTSYIDCSGLMDSWNHLAISSSYNGMELKVYLNGKLIHSDSETDVPDLGLLGIRLNDFWGQLARATLWNREKTETEIRNSMGSSIDQSDLLYDWKFDDPSMVVGISPWGFDSIRFWRADDYLSKYGEVAFLSPRPGIIQDLSIDLAKKKMYLAGDQKILIGKLDGSSLQELYTQDETIHSLTYDGVTGMLYWIQGRGKLYKADVTDINNRGSAIEMESQLAPGIDGVWSLTVDAKSQTLYWTNGKEIWFGRIQESRNELWSKLIHVPHAESPYPLDLDVDTTYNRLCWVDRALERVCIADAHGTVQHSFEAKNVRKGIAVDDELGMVYWTSHYIDKRDMPVIEEPGCFFFAQDTNDGKRFQAAPSIPLIPLFDIHWKDSSAAKKGSNFPLALKPDGSQPQVMNFERENKDFIDLGPMFLSFKEGFSIEIWVKFRSIDSSTLVCLGSKDTKNVIELSVTYFGWDVDYDYGTVDGKNVRILHNSLRSSATNNEEFQQNTWFHLAFTIDKTGIPYMYVNGKEESFEKRGLPQDGVRIKNFIGGYHPIGNPNIDGEIASLRISNVFTDAETIQAHFQHPPSSIEDLIQNDRSESFVFREGYYLMRGDLNGDYDDYEPEGLFPLVSEGGLALASKTEEGHLKRIAASRKRLQAQRQANLDLMLAREKAAAKVKKAHEDKDADHAKSRQLLASAKQDASNKRKAAHRSLLEAPDKANRIKSDAKIKAKERKAQADQQAEHIKQDAHNKKERMVRDAKDDLADAKHERSRYKK
ncbi:MAG: LamG-like jellyroll fold domain-containing protein [Bacteroidota bacterium]